MLIFLPLRMLLGTELLQGAPFKVTHRRAIEAKLPGDGGWGVGASVDLAQPVAQAEYLLFARSEACQECLDLSAYRLTPFLFCCCRVCQHERWSSQPEMPFDEPLFRLCCLLRRE